MNRIDKRPIILALAMGFILTSAVSLKGYSEAMQGAVAEQVIRFHVRANSNSEADQNLKVLVKEKVLERFRPGLDESSDLEGTRGFLTENLEAIEEYAGEVVTGQGYGYKVTAAITTDYFPTKTYGDLRLPAGDYEALRIDIGAAEGDNWWCVMFPPLCFVDVSLKEVPAREKAILRDVLTEEEYALVAGEGSDIEIKFKAVEIWQKLKARGELYFARK